MKLIEAYDGLLVDLDGVVYTGNQPIDSAIETIEKLSSKIPVGYVTNNASRTQEQLLINYADSGSNLINPR